MSYSARPLPNRPRGSMRRRPSPGCAWGLGGGAARRDAAAAGRGGAPGRRLCALLAAALAALGALAPPAFAHAVLIGTSPAAGARLARSPELVRLRFSEPIQLLQPADLDVVDAGGRSVAAGPAWRDPTDARVIQV